MSLKPIYLLITALLLVGTARAQTPETTVKQIRADYEAVNRQIPKLHVVRREITGESTEGGEVVGYYTSNGALRKMIVTHLGEMGKRVQEVYLLPQGHRFILESAIRYDKPFGKPVLTIQTRFYLKGYKLVRLLQDNKTVPVEQLNAREHTSSVLNDVRVYQAMLRRPNANP